MLNNYIATWDENFVYSKYFLRIAAPSQLAAIHALERIGFAPRYLIVLPAGIGELVVEELELIPFPDGLKEAH